jgi:hypothetical protein
MKRPQPDDVLRRYHAALEARDLATVATILSERCRYQSKGIGTVTGRAQIVGAIAAYLAAHPDHQAVDDEVVSEGSSLVHSRWRLWATNAETGVIVQRSGRETLSIGSDGLIRRIDVEDDET